MVNYNDDMSQEKRKRGRPKGGRFGANLFLRVDPETQAAIKTLAEHWDCSDSEAVRRAVLESRERIDTPEGQKIDRLKAALLEAAKKLR